MAVTLIPLDDLFADDLRDPEFRRDYLSAALAEGTEPFLFALQRCARALGNARPITDGRATFSAVRELLDAMDLRLTIRKLPA